MKKILKIIISILLAGKYSPLENTLMIYNEL